MIRTAYYFLQHMYTLVPHHVDDDMAWMADHGVDSVAIGILEQDFQASWRNLDHLFAAAQRRGVRVRFTPSRWCGLFAGAGKVPSMWACNHPEAWSLDESGQARVNKYSGLICSIHHPAVFDFVMGNIERLITRWPVSGIIWDELKTLHLRDHHPLAVDALGTDAPLDKHVAATAGFFKRINQEAKGIRPDLITSMFIYAHCAGSATVRLALRIPAWCHDARIDGLPVQATADGWYLWERRVEGRTAFTLDLPAPITSSHWPGGGTALQRGPLTFSLPVETERTVLQAYSAGHELPAWAHRPASSAWAMAVEESTLDQVRLVSRATVGHPWDQAGCPIALELPMRRVADWGLEELAGFQRWRGNGTEPLPPSEAEWVDGRAVLTPPLPRLTSADERLGLTETVQLLPLGACPLRLTVFPTVPAAVMT